MSGCTIVNVKKPNKIVILEKRVDQLNYTNNFGKLIRRIQVELMVGLTTHEIYDSLANEGHWAPDSLHEAIKLATEGLR
ncbi:hypothetical protein [Bacillus albus]|uniref:hypothetical protein n=1 Tax=Bacillus albus TaxID=2026189 RepID=UPI00101F1DCB|nr:hypothetical protein [Bacillus albus]